MIVNIFPIFDIVIKSVDICKFLLLNMVSMSHYMMPDCNFTRSMQNIMRRDLIYYIDNVFGRNSP